GRPFTLSEPRPLHVNTGAGFESSRFAYFAKGPTALFHCEHGSPLPAGRNTCSAGPAPTITSRENIPASTYCFDLSSMTSVVPLAGSRTIAPKPDVSPDWMRTLPFPK